LRNRIPGHHCSGKTVIVGHTPQKSGEVLDLGHLVCIDTFCCGGGWLTAMDLGTGEILQANQKRMVKHRLRHNGRRSASPPGRRLLPTTRLHFGVGDLPGL
jgi:serine/threonine protein phosphatase 1